MRQISKLVFAAFLLSASIPATPKDKTPTDLGNFSISLTVKDIEASKAFYEKLGFVQVRGDSAKGWVILNNGDTKIGLFQGMFERNTITFNPRWDQDGKPAARGQDIRIIQKRLRAAGIDAGADIKTTRGPASFETTDPDGNPILFDQHL